MLNKIAKWKTKQNTITDMRISPVSGFTGLPSPWFWFSKSSRLFCLFRSNYFTKGRITVEPPPMAAAKTDVPTAHCSDPLSPMLFDQSLIKRTKKKKLINRHGTVPICQTNNTSEVLPDRESELSLVQILSKARKLDIVDTDIKAS